MCKNECKRAGDYQGGTHTHTHRRFEDQPTKENEPPTYLPMPSVGEPAQELELRPDTQDLSHALAVMVGDHAAKEGPQVVLCSQGHYASVKTEEVHYTGAVYERLLVVLEDPAHQDGYRLHGDAVRGDVGCTPCCAAATAPVSASCTVASSSSSCRSLCEAVPHGPARHVAGQLSPGVAVPVHAKVLDHVIVCKRVLHKLAHGIPLLLIGDRLTVHELPTKKGLESQGTCNRGIQQKKGLESQGTSTCMMDCMHG